MKNKAPLIPGYAALRTEVPTRLPAVAATRASGFLCLAVPVIRLGKLGAKKSEWRTMILVPHVHRAEFVRAFGYQEFERRFSYRPTWHAPNVGEGDSPVSYETNGERGTFINCSSQWVDAAWIVTVTKQCLTEEQSEATKMLIEVAQAALELTGEKI